MKSCSHITELVGKHCKKEKENRKEKKEKRKSKLKGNEPSHERNRGKFEKIKDCT